MTKAEILEMQATNIALRQELAQIKDSLRLAELRIALLEKKEHCPSSEKLDESQLELLQLETHDELERPAAASAHVLDDPELDLPPRKPTHAAPQNLAEKTEVLEPAPQEKVCEHCGEAKCRIGEEVTEELEIIPAQFIKRRIVRPKYACRCGEAGVVIAPLPPRAIEKGRPGPGLLTHVLLNKYADHLPLYRQEQIFRERTGVIIPRQTMSGWIEKCAELLQPIYREMKKEMLAGDYLQVDETPVRVMDPEVKGKAAHGYFWIYAQPGGDVLFDFNQSRGIAPVKEFLHGFSGTIQTDAYQVYESLCRQNPSLKRIGCWAHARRKFHDALVDQPEEAIWFIGKIRELYLIEKRAREGGVSVEERQRLREANAPPVLAAIKERLDALKGKHLPKSPMGGAINYLSNEWQALNGYVANGSFEIDNNLIENAIRPSAIGKKNWLFLGHPDAAWRSAVIYSIMESCRRRNINPAIYIKDVLERLPAMKTSELPAITPSRWTAKAL